MSISTLLKKLFNGSADVEATPMVVTVNEAGALQDYVAQDDAEKTISLTLRGPLNGDDFTYLHKAFKNLEELDLTDVEIEGGRFVCAKHKNYYDLNPGELSAHTLHIGKLRRVTLPVSVKNVVLSGFGALNFGATSDTSELTRMSGAFAFELEKIIVPASNQYYSSEDGVLYNKEKTELLKCPVSHSREVQFPSSLKKIADNAMRECGNLVDVEFPEGVEEIGEYALYGCKSLKRITFPSTAKIIGDNVFAHCFDLSKVACRSRVPASLEMTRRTNMANCRLEVPAGAASDYSKISPWADFEKIEEEA